MESEAEVRVDAISDGVERKNYRYLQDLQNSCSLIQDRLNSNQNSHEIQAQNELVPTPSSGGPIPSKPMPIEDFLGPVFELSGIKASRRISLSLYVSSGSQSFNVKISTFQSFLQLLSASIGTYQIVLNDPEIEGLDIQPFKINFLIVNFSYDPKLGFYNLDVHTDVEEIYPETGSPEKIRERAMKLLVKVGKVLEFVALFKDLARIAGVG